MINKFSVIARRTLQKQSHSLGGAGTALHKLLALTYPLKFLCLLLVLAALLAGCASRTAEDAGVPSAKAQDPLAQAAAEATSIVSQARATALIVQAQVQATALIQQAHQPPQPQNTPSPLPATITIEPDRPAPTTNPTKTSGGSLPSSGIPTNVVIEQPVIARQGDFELFGISFAADGGFIMINFRAPPDQVAQLYQGTVSVTDEATGDVYDEIPVLPVIGPMVGRPVEAGQRGYVMLVNSSPALKTGATVTVALGEYRFEHIPVGP